MLNLFTPELVTSLQLLLRTLLMEAKYLLAPVQVSPSAGGDLGEEKVTSNVNTGTTNSVLISFFHLFISTYLKCIECIPLQLNKLVYIKY